MFYGCCGVSGCHTLLATLLTILLQVRDLGVMAYESLLLIDHLPVRDLGVMAYE
jgi:hypothetical protein